ncbi:MAG: membrane dipeptidase [Rhizomicrobium sp.]
MTEAAMEKARTLIADCLVWDNHACMPLRPDDDGHLPQMESYRTAGVDVVSLNVGFGAQPLDSHIQVLAAFRRWFSAHADRYALVAGLADIDRARRDGKLAILFDIEGMAPLDAGDHGLIARFHDLGVRWMSVAYNRNNAAGGGCYDADTGLTSHGRRILAESKRVGMVVCCSHTGHRTAREVIDRADNPVIFSHSNPAAAHAHPRNIPGDLIRACAANGGVIGISGVSVLLGDRDCQAETIARHIDHVAQCVGADHVGIALDHVFDEMEFLDDPIALGSAFPSGAAPAGPIKTAPPSVVPGVVAVLLGRGYGDAEVRKILGGNWRRVAEQVWGA